MNKYLLRTLIALVVFVALIGFVKFQQIRVAMAQGAAWRPPPESVTTVVAEQKTWPATMSAIGTVVAAQGVVVSADLPGIVDRIHFESGRRVQAGAVLVSLDVAQERSQLEAAQAQSHLAKLKLDRGRKLLEQQVLAQAEFDALEAEHATAEARVGEIQATIARKQIRAPFSGVLGIRQVNDGQFLNSGQPVVSLQQLDPVYVDFTLPQQDAAALRTGSRVEISGEGVRTLTGQVTAIDAVFDEATRNIRAQATLRNVGGALKPGMFVDVHLTLGADRQVMPLPASAIHYAPYGNSVFVVGEVKGPDGKAYKGVTQKFVKVGAGRGDQVAIVDGIAPGDEVVSSGVFKLRNGAAVEVNNKVQPGNDPAPKPEDN
jgi:membrane fusion protein (multidrug efflux system)